MDMHPKKIAIYSLITTHNDFDSADRSSIQDTCQKWTQLNDLALCEFSKLSGEHLEGVWEVTGSIPVRDSDFYLCPRFMSCWSVHVSHKMKFILCQTWTDQPFTGSR